MGKIFGVSLVWLCLVGHTKGGQGASRMAPPPASHVWDGPCGKPTLSGAQWLKISPVFKSNSKPTAVMQALEDHIVGTPDDIARSMPWHMAISVPEMVRNANNQRSLTTIYRGAATLIRGLPGVDESDLAVTNSYTCSRIWQAVRNWKSGVLSKAPTAVFAAYDLRGSGFLTIPIKDCYHSINYAYSGEEDIREKAFISGFGIIQLSERIPFTGHARPVCMPEADEKIPVGTNVIVGAWDFPDDITKEAPLRRINLRVVDRSQCRNRPREDRSDDIFCIEKETVDRRILVGGGAILGQRKDGAFVMLGIANVNQSLYTGLDNLATSVPYFIRRGWMEGVIRKIQSGVKMNW